MIKREIYLKRIRPFYGSEMVKVITGIRRCGKSTIMRQIIEEIQENGVEEDHIIYSTFPPVNQAQMLDFSSKIIS